jgi:3-methylcrotonyl-CoA carboxylase alpha subunit
VEEGDRIPPDYDPLIAKLMVHAADRPAAIARLERALTEFEIGGIQTMLPFHRFVADSPAFRSAELSTGFVEEHWDGPAERGRAVRIALLAAAVDALATATEGRSDGSVVLPGTPAATPDASVTAPSRSSAPSRWGLEGRSAGTEPWQP